MTASASAPTPAPIPTAGPITITGPLTLAELLDRTFRALRAKFSVLILSAAIIIVPLGILTTLISGRFMAGYFDLLQYSMNQSSTPDIVPEQFIGDMLGYFGAIMLLSILSMLGTTLVSMMSMHHIQSFLHGKNSTVADGWRVAIRRFWPMIGLQILEFLIIGAITAAITIVAGILFFVIALIFGGAMAGLGNDTANIILGIGMVIVILIGYFLVFVLVLAPTIFFMGRWIAAAPSLMIEELGPVNALQRSWALTKGRIWRSLLYIILLTLLSAIVIGVPVSITQMVATLLLPTQIALITTIATIVSYLLNLFYQPFYATGIVLFYYDLRVRGEAYDVALRVTALEAEVTPDAPPE